LTWQWDELQEFSHELLSRWDELQKFWHQCDEKSNSSHNFWDEYQEKSNSSHNFSDEYQEKSNPSHNFSDEYHQKSNSSHNFRDEHQNWWYGFDLECDGTGRDFGNGRRSGSHTIHRPGMERAAEHVDGWLNWVAIDLAIERCSSGVYWLNRDQMAPVSAS
jgi:hypothetical protein